MSRLALILGALLIAGCLNPADIKVRRTTTSLDGTVETVETTVRAPKYSLDGSQVMLGDNGVDVWLSASQKAKDIEGALSDGASKKIVYGGLALIMLLGAVALALPNYLVSNKDALLVIGSGVVGFVVFRYVEASAGLMGILIPIVAVCVGVYFAWRWWQSRNVT